MATASLDQARIVAFALEHGTSAAARRFRVSDSYVRRLKRSAAPVAPARAGLRLVSAPSVPVSRVCQLQLQPANMVASRGAMWRCPACHELVTVAPGTIWNDWIKQKKCLHGAEASPVISPVMSVQALPKAPEEVPEQKSAFVASQSSSSAVPVPIHRSGGLDDDVWNISLARVAPTSSPRFAAVMAFLLPWLAEYWRVPLAIVVALVVICLCASGLPR